MDCFPLPDEGDDGELSALSDYRYYPVNFFSTTVIGGINSIKSNAGIIKKVYFPREILLLSQVASGLSISGFRV